MFLVFSPRSGKLIPQVSVWSNKPTFFCYQSPKRTSLFFAVSSFFPSSFSLSCFFSLSFSFCSRAYRVQKTRVVEIYIIDINKCLQADILPSRTMHNNPAVHSVIIGSIQHIVNTHSGSTSPFSSVGEVFDIDVSRQPSVLWCCKDVDLIKET